MPLVATEGRAREGGDVPLPASYEVADGSPHAPAREEDSMNASATIHGSRDGSNLRFWRIAVFGGIGLLYLVSLFVPPLREALAKLFSYFPQ